MKTLNSNGEATARLKSSFGLSNKFSVGLNFWVKQVVHLLQVWPLEGFQEKALYRNNVRHIYVCVDIKDIYIYMRCVYIYI